MARILVGSVPVVGHINPLVPIVRALCARGHEIRWYTGAKYRSKVETTGAQYVGLTYARDYDDAQIEREFSGRAKLRGMAQLKFDMKHIFMDNGPGQLRDLQQIAQSFAPDLLFCEAASFGGLFYSELSGVPLVVLGVIPLPRSSIDTAPFGLGLAPNVSALGRIRNRALNWAVEHVLFRDVQHHWERAGWHASNRACHARDNRQRGARADRAHARWAGERGRAVVVATGGRPPDSLRLRNVPSNARVGTFLSYPELLPKTSVMVTNGGYGGVQMALAQVFHWPWPARPRTNRRWRRVSLALAQA